MPTRSSRSKRARADTDRSLREERTRTDEELERRTPAEADAARTLERARARADEVLQSARSRADARLAKEGPEAREAVAQERDREDRQVAGERREADQQRETQREAANQVLRDLLRYEREQTDERLLLERSRSDIDLESRDDFMGLVSHDLRTLLAGIALNAAMVSRKGQSAPVTEAAERIQRSVARMNRLLGDLLDVVSIEAGRLAIAPTPRDATALLRETLDVFQPLAAAKDVSLTVRTSTDALIAPFDHARVLQVLANLISNALKFTDAGGRISVDVEPLGNELRFAVSDTGKGIAPEKTQAIFQRYWQVDPNERRGLGLGLFISRSIVDAHGGRIWVESTVGQGSTFFFTLPSER